MGNECYDGATNKKLLTESEPQRHQGRRPLQRSPPARSAPIDGKVPVTTTTVGNSGNSGGGIF